MLIREKNLGNFKKWLFLHLLWGKRGEGGVHVYLTRGRKKCQTTEKNIHQRGKKTEMGKKNKVQNVVNKTRNKKFLTKKYVCAFLTCV